MQKVSIMGILNVTPDSFSDGGLYYNNIEKAILRVKEMLNEGADIIDIGGESTRPGSVAVSTEEEIARILPVIIAIRKELGGNIQISIDTYKSKVALAALNNGANIINSLGGTIFDQALINIVQQKKCLFIIYHIKGLPKTMQSGDITYTDVVNDIAAFFKDQIETALKIGVSSKQLIIDPGIGFGKTMEQNIAIIKRLNEFQIFHLPILIGVSRKSHLGVLLKSKLHLADIPPAQDRLEASLAETAIAVLKGASIIRTHDIAQTKKFITVFENLI